MPVDQVPGTAHLRPDGSTRERWIVSLRRLASRLRGRPKRTMPATSRPTTDSEVSTQDELVAARTTPLLPFVIGAAAAVAVLRRIRRR